jgi:hypothetical protein
VWAQEGSTPWPFSARLRNRTLERIRASLGEARTAELTVKGALLGDEHAAALAFSGQAGRQPGPQ